MANADRLQNANLYTFAPASAYGADINILPSIKETLKTTFPDMNWEHREADIYGISIKSAAAFTVKLNNGTKIVAQNNGTEYSASYVGFIDYVVFTAQTTATAVSMYWDIHDKTHKLVELNAPSGATLTLTDDYGYAVYPDADGKYELQKGWYILTSGTVSNRFLYDFSSAFKNHLDFALATITLGSDLTYNGSEQTKGVTVAYGGVTLTANTHYVVTGNKATDAGSYTMQISGIGIFDGMVSKEWNIAKANPTMSISPNSLSIVAEATGEITVTTDSDGELSVVSSAEETATAEIAETTVTVTGVAAGNANVTVKQAASNNYNAATDAVCAVTVTSE